MAKFNTFCSVHTFCSPLYPLFCFISVKNITFGVAINNSLLRSDFHFTVCCGLVSTLFFINSPPPVESNRLFLWIPLREVAFHLQFLHFPRFSVQIPRVSNFPREFLWFPRPKEKFPDLPDEIPRHAFEFPRASDGFPTTCRNQNKKSDSVKGWWLSTVKATPTTPV